MKKTGFIKSGLMWGGMEQNLNLIRKRAGIFLVILAAWIFGMMASADSIAAETLNIEEINYENSTLTLSTKNGDIRGFFKKKGQSKWETMSGYFKDNKITMDISWISATSNYSLVFKGDKSTDEKTLVIPKVSSNLKVEYNVSNEEKTGSPIRFTNAGDRTVEWRKNNGTTWSPWSPMKSEALNYLIANGTTLYFRLAPINGTSISNNGQRAGKEVALRISAKKTAPDVGFNDSSFTVSLKSGMMYRIAVMKDGTVSDVDTRNKEWTKITSSREYSLTEICPTALSAECALQFKTGYKGNTQESRVKTIIVPAQESLTAAEKDGIKIAYTSTKSFNLTISGASDSKPYQYCIVKKEDYNNGKLSYSDLNWVDVKTTAPVAITKTKAPEGSRIYVRKKANKSLGEEGYAISSKEEMFPGVDGIKYPSAIGLNSVQKYNISAGCVNKGEHGTSLTFTINSYTSTTVSKIMLCNASGGEVGEVDFTSTVNENASPQKDNSDKYIITTKITDTSKLETAINNAYNSHGTNYYGTDLYAKITLANDASAPIESSADKGLIINMSPKSKINNPTKTSGTGYSNLYLNHYLKSVTRLYMCSGSGSNISNSTLSSYGEDNYFKFLLEIGSSNLKGDVGIKSITYDNCELTGGMTTANESGDYSDSKYTSLPGSVIDVKYQLYTDSYGYNDARRAFVTVNLLKLEEKLEQAKGSSVKMNQSIPLVITLTNGEVLDSDIYITLKATATIDGGSIYYTDTAGSLPMPYYKNEYDNNGKVTSTTKVTPVEHTFTLTLFDSSYPRGGIKDITWGGSESVLKSAVTSGKTVTIELSNAKINALPASRSENLHIVFANGFVIKSGCVLTILDGVPENSISGSSTSAKSAWLGYSLAQTALRAEMQRKAEEDTVSDSSAAAEEGAVSDGNTAEEGTALDSAVVAENVAVTEINYNEQTITVDPSGNDIVYFSTNKTTWNEIDAITVEGGKMKMDISWIAPTTEKKLYFKGNKATATTMVTVPKLNSSIKVKFDSKSGTVVISGYEDATQFLWRKSTDYNWMRVDIDDDSASYKAFLDEIEGLRVMGAKIYVMTDQVKGTVAAGTLDTGVRPSKQIKVNITKRAAAPSISVNIKKLTLNTTAKMEYLDENTGKWVPCEKNMKLKDITSVPFEGKDKDAVSVVLQIRKAETKSAGASKVKVLAIPKQPAAPKAAEAYSVYIETSGTGSDAKKKTVISFPIAKGTAPVEYAVVKPGAASDESKVSWRTVKDPKKLIKLSQNAAPEGTKIYVRIKGVSENVKKGIDLQLPSAYLTYEVGGK